MVFVWHPPTRERPALTAAAVICARCFFFSSLSLRIISYVIQGTCVISICSVRCWRCWPLAAFRSLDIDVRGIQLYPESKHWLYTNVMQWTLTPIRQPKRHQSGRTHSDTQRDCHNLPLITRRAAAYASCVRPVCLSVSGFCLRIIDCRGYAKCSLRHA